MGAPRVAARPPADGNGANGRSESALERLDRNAVELLNGLRVAATGIQVLFGFLLIVPFNARFSHLTSVQRAIYMITLVCIAGAAISLIAPAVHHRLLFRRGEKEYLVETGTRLMIISGVFLAAGTTGIILLVSTFVIGGVGGAFIAACIAAFIFVLWFALPLKRRRRRKT